MLIDTHCHLTDKQFCDDIEAVIAHSRDVGVKFFVTSGFDLDSSIKAVEFASVHNNVFASIGIYPEYSGFADEKTFAQLEELASSEKVVAIGEIGLQFTDGAPEKEVQIKVFERQIDLAFRLKKPIVIHCREAMGACLETLEKNKDKLVYGGTMHCFSGSRESAIRVLKLGLNISVGGVSTFKNASNLREALSFVPLEKIVLETDCPYLAPHPFRGKRNSPAFLPGIAENLAKILGKDVAEVEKVTSENAIKLFGLEE